MKKTLIFVLLAMCMLLTACRAASIGIIGGSDGPTAVFVGKDDNMRASYDVDKYFKKNYVNERKLPVFDIQIDREFVSEDRKLILDDTIENQLEHIVYEFYRNSVSGEFEKIYDVVAGEYLKSAIEAEEKDFKDGIYFESIFIDEIDLVDKDDLKYIKGENQQRIIELLDAKEMEEFALVEAEMTIKHNEKSLSQIPQVGDGEIERFYLIGKKDGKYNILEVYWEGFINE